MPNKHFNEQIYPGGLKNAKGTSPGTPSGGKTTEGFREKPAFPGADLPGKSQPKDRSGGVMKAKVSPKRIGL
jgi:hypothetical protein